MMIQKLSFLVALILSASPTFGKPLQTFYLPVKQSPSMIYSLSVRVGVQEPDDNPIGDILYFTGFGDRLDNHGPLFDAWVASGFRVISFDYPSHGETTGTPLDLFNFTRLAELATQVEKATRQDDQRPPILSGWSTGGLLAVRMAQARSLPAFEQRKVAGLILFAPGISVKAIVGTPNWHYWFGEITNATLTHDPNPPHKGDAQPKSPVSLSSFAFTPSLLTNAWLSREEKFPDLPTLMFVAGDRGDVYANSESLKNWVVKQNLNGAEITMIAFPGARHEIDNETAEYGGPQSRHLAAEFAKAIVSSDTKSFPPQD